MTDFTKEIAALIIFALFVAQCLILPQKKYSTKATVLVWTSGLLVIITSHIFAFAFKHGIYDNALILSLLPVTAYLPTAILFFIMGKGTAVEKTLMLFICLLTSVVMVMLRKAVGVLLLQVFLMQGIGFAIAYFFSLITVAALLFLITLLILKKVFRSEIHIELRKPFIIIPLVLLLLMSLYIKDMTIDWGLLVFVLAVDVSMLLIIIAYLKYQAKNNYLAARCVAEQKRLQTVKEEYNSALQAVALGQAYRHDMKHHFVTINRFLAENNATELKKYVASLEGKLSDISKIMYTENEVLNATLCSYIEKAQAMQCKVTVSVNAPKELPFEEIDLCAVIANVVENATNAVDKIVDTNLRAIDITIEYNDGKLLINVKNTVAENVDLGEDGLPIAEKLEEHGFGLISVKKTVQKYNGILRCFCMNNTFTIQIILFKPKQENPNKKNKNKPIRAFCCALLCLPTILVALNSMPATVAALETVPVVKDIVRVVDFRTWGWKWGDSGINVKLPETNNKDLNKKIEEYTETCLERFRWYYTKKYDGYVMANISYQTIADNNKIFTLRFNATINAGSSDTFSRCFTVDKQTGEILAFSALFLKNSDYNRSISSYIKEQMRITVESGRGDYFGFGIFESDPGFESLDDPNFYIDEELRLVIMFNEQEVAPGNMGAPQFTIPKAVIAEILNDNSYIEKGG